MKAAADCEENEKREGVLKLAAAIIKEMEVEDANVGILWVNDLIDALKKELGIEIE